MLARWEFSHEYLRWAWPRAARLANELSDRATAAELLALLYGYRKGQLAPMLRAERDLVRARQAAAEHDQSAAEDFAAAIGSLRGSHAQSCVGRAPPPSFREGLADGPMGPTASPNASLTRCSHRARSVRNAGSDRTAALMAARPAGPELEGAP